MLEPVGRSDELLETPCELLRDDGVAQMRVRVPQARGDQPGREWIPRSASADFDDDIIFPSHRAITETSAIIEPAGDALHIRAKGGIAFNIGGPLRSRLGIFIAWELFLAVAPP